MCRIKEHIERIKERRKPMAPLYGHMVSIGEMVLTRQQMEELEFRHNLIEMIDEIDAQQITIDKNELENRINEAFQAFKKDRDAEIPVAVSVAIRRKFEEIDKKTDKPHSCPQCGAPLHGNKCDYCQTEY